MISSEHNLFLFLQSAIVGSPDGDPLHDAELHDTEHQVITHDRGIRIGDGRSQLAPNADGSLAEFDAEVELTCFVRVAGTDKTERLTARDGVIDLAAAVARLFYNDQTLGGRVCDLQIGPIRREFASINGQPFALARMPITINPSG